MAHSKARNLAPAPAQRVPAIPMTVEEVDYDEAPSFDLATFDPAEFEWRPVPRRPRADGWTPDVQRAFIDQLAATGMVEHAALHVDMSVQSAYRLRNAPGGEGFAHAWSVAIGTATARVLDLAFARVIEGEETPVFDCDGRRIGARRKVSERMTMFLLRAYMPERFRHAHQDVRLPSEAPVLALPPPEVAMAALLPPVPAEPHLLLAPDLLERVVEGARSIAEVDALYPADDRECYVRQRVEEDHPTAVERGARRHKRERARHDREQAADALKDVPRTDY